MVILLKHIKFINMVKLLLLLTLTIWTASNVEISAVLQTIVVSPSQVTQLRKLQKN